MKKINANFYDAVVIGLGGMGSATVYNLSKENIKTAGIEQFCSPHDKGSSHGDTRIYRQLYMEGAEYTRLLLRAERLWEDIEKTSGRTLFHRCNMLSVGDNPDGGVLGNALKAGKEYGLQHTLMDAGQTEKAYPFLKLPKNHMLCEDPNGGILLPELCIKTYLERAEKNGADIIQNTRVLNIERTGGLFEINTSADVYFADRLIITAGPWSRNFLGAVGDKLNISRQVLTYIKLSDDLPKIPGFMPNLLIESEDKDCYGIFGPEGHSLKVGSHMFSLAFSDSPESIDRTVVKEESEDVIKFFKQFIPKGLAGYEAGKTCIYTMTPDDNFIVDTAEDGKLVYACGFSGHGFKFCSVVGEALSDMAQEKEPQCPIGFLSADRFGH